MPNIKPVSDLRNYASVLKDVTVWNPVFLTKNGCGCYAILDLKEYEDYEKDKASMELMSELNKGIKAGEEEGWVSEEEANAHFTKIKYEK